MHLATFLTSVLPLLSVPLPRVWDMIEGGLAEPVRAESEPGNRGFMNVMGGDYDLDNMVDAVKAFGQKTQLDVHNPLCAWQQAMNAVKVHLPELEVLRRNMEQRTKELAHEQAAMQKEKMRKMGVKPSAIGGSTARTAPAGMASLQPKVRTFGSIFTRCLHPSSVMHDGPNGLGGPGGAENQSPLQHGGGGPEDEHEDMADNVPASVMASERSKAQSLGWKEQELHMKLKDSERQWEAATQSYNQLEVSLTAQLSGLCADASWLKSYMAAQLLLLKELMQEEAYWLGSTKQALPMSLSNVESSARGKLSNNDEVNLSIPMVLLDTPQRHALLDHLMLFSPSDNLTSLRSTFSPLESRGGQGRLPQGGGGRSSRPGTGATHRSSATAAAGTLAAGSKGGKRDFMAVHHGLEETCGTGDGAWEEENGVMPSLVGAGDDAAVHAGGWGLSMPQKFDAVAREEEGKHVSAKGAAEWRDVKVPEAGVAKDSVWSDKKNVGE
ncbi:hypothetical protein CEUSTIGMA_g2464.t1 [Chlamydomonas eustigma]|uniref:Uncharacterized protein n=1 Tax=Chlamydomonas eustigma TaxID=1157962 RepID=A0A250WW11_9CHLO|nr:hypothetical protein CEUSTIGMA_g2464.t1 [Chlamydomonas eustigma]|eukprot:GAX75018.1 hypothetical protein CEUSTIGMA_g2464.t1 [Chlamydomonas eustigma]